MKFVSFEKNGTKFGIHKKEINSMWVQVLCSGYGLWERAEIVSSNE